MPSSTAPWIVWFRDDLRISDHPALREAADSGAPIVCLYVHDEASAPLQPPKWRPLGAASKWWLAGSLRALAQDLEKRGVSLTLRQGSASEIIPKLADEIGASTVTWNTIAIRPLADVADTVAQKLDDLGIAAKRCAGDLLAHPADIRTKDGRAMRVFTPFWRRVQALGDPTTPLPAPRRLKAAAEIASDTLDDWGFEPTTPDWAGGMRAMWTPGERGAHAALDRFLGETAQGYRNARDRMDREATSHLSPHLRFGEITPRQVWHAAQFAADQTPKLKSDVEKFLSELGWREFCRHQLAEHPDLHRHCLQPRFEDFPWRHDEAALRAWQRGLTGYPIVDAGMRELWTTGVMHNRVRMIAASFLIKHLLLDWRVGEAWFWDTLVDADPGSNPANWQWVAGCGADAAPYFRIFSPVLQGEKFDPQGDYVRQWVPELKDMNAKVIHQPWKATPMELSQAGVVLGTTYPEPIVDHAVARKRALAALATLKE